MPRTKTQTEQIRAESRAKIIATARRLFAERGFDGCKSQRLPNRWDEPGQHLLALCLER